jgi:hypothetical protein
VNSTMNWAEKGSLQSESLNITTDDFKSCSPYATTSYLAESCIPAVPMQAFNIPLSNKK